MVGLTAGTAFLSAERASTRPRRTSGITRKAALQIPGDCQRGGLAQRARDAAPSAQIADPDAGLSHGVSGPATERPDPAPGTRRGKPGNWEKSGVKWTRMAEAKSVIEQSLAEYLFELRGGRTRRIRASAAGWPRLTWAASGPRRFGSASGRERGAGRCRSGTPAPGARAHRAPR